MASRRELKKNVNYIAGELFTECLINTCLSLEQIRIKQMS